MPARPIRTFHLDDFVLLVAECLSGFTHFVIPYLIPCIISITHIPYRYPILISDHILSLWPWMTDDVAYGLQKFDVESFDGCPAAPVPAHFQGDGRDPGPHVIHREGVEGLLWGCLGGV